MSARRVPIILGCLIFLGGASASASKGPRPAVVVLPLLENSWVRGGAMIGGQASADDLSMVRVERLSRSSESGGGERVTLTYGDKVGRPLRAQPGYFHLALDRAGRRVSLDLAQVSRTAVDRRDLERIFARSSLVSEVDIVMDPEDGSTHISLSTRAPVEARVVAKPGDGLAPASLALDLRPIAAETKAR